MSDNLREAVEALIHDYAVIRGDLSEQYARAQLRDKFLALADSTHAETRAEVSALRERLRMAERVCALSGWTAIRQDSERDKAATQAWMEWSASRPGMSDRAAWPDLDDAGIAALARKRDQIRAATLAALAPTPDREASAEGGDS